MAGSIYLLKLMYGRTVDIGRKHGKKGFDKGHHAKPNAKQHWGQLKFWGFLVLYLARLTVNISAMYAGTLLFKYL